MGSQFLGDGGGGGGGSGGSGGGENAFFKGAEKLMSGVDKTIQFTADRARDAYKSH